MRIFPVLLFSAIIILQKDDYVSTKPVPNEKSFSDDSYGSGSNSRCGNNNDELLDQNTYDKNSDLYHPRPRYEVAERLASRNYNLKRDDGDEDGLRKQEKRQVGVIYRDERPIGILQPYQRSYRFIAVKDEDPYAADAVQAQTFDSNYAQNSIGKRSVDDNYPAILASFKIDSRLDKIRDKKRSNLFDASLSSAENLVNFNPNDVDDLKSTIRRLRSSHPSDQVEEELKSILDDMGLLSDDEVRPEKREIKSDDRVWNNKEEDESLLDDSPDESPERNKRDDKIQKSKMKTLEEKRNEKDNVELDDIVEKRDEEQPGVRTKRQKAVDNKIERTVEHKDEVAFNSPTIDKDSDYDKRVEREIQQKIENLKEEVKREIAALNEKKGEKRRKRATLDDEETDAVDPIKHPDAEMKALVRKRRSAVDDEETYEDLVKKKRDENEEIYEKDPRAARTKRNQEDDDKIDFFRQKRMGNIFKSTKDNIYNNNNEERGGLDELLEFEDNNKNPKVQSFNKQQLCSANINNNNNNNDENNERIIKRDGKSKVNQEPYEEEEIYEDVDSNDRGKREDFEYSNENETGSEFNEMKPRVRRRIVEEAPGEKLDRPQQLSDMNDVDLFGALPKGFDGELSRYKRVRK